MKTCLVCGAHAPASLHTCPSCGCADWAATTQPPTVTPRPAARARAPRPGEKD